MHKAVCGAICFFIFSLVWFVSAPLFLLEDAGFASADGIKNWDLGLGQPIDLVTYRYRSLGLKTPRVGMARQDCIVSASA
jgi:hypothetical protein